MRLLCYFGCSPATGYGHFYRSNALARVARERGHTVTVACDRKPLYGLPWLPTVYDSPDSLALAIRRTKPDWLIVDIPHDLPGWIRGMTHGRICTLNGIGYNQADGSDLRVIQSTVDVTLPGPQDRVPVIKGIEYVILRPEIVQYKDLPRENGRGWLCWGGGLDVMGLLPRFPVACPDKTALLLAGDMTPIPALNLPQQTVVRVDPESEQMFNLLGTSWALCTAMGMICPEAAYLRLIQKVFSATPLHLRFAEGLARQGLIDYWPAVGLPSNEEMREFINTPFIPWGQPPDEHGAERVMKAIEGYVNI